MKKKTFEPHTHANELNNYQEQKKVFCVYYIYNSITYLNRVVNEEALV